jgi:hypothetical protein
MKISTGIDPKGRIGSILLTSQSLNPLIPVLLYVSLSAAKLTGKKAKQLDIEKLKALPAVQEKLAESRNQLDKYRLVLESKYGNLLRLRTYSVVAVGFDRLVVESED